MLHCALLVSAADIHDAGDASVSWAVGLIIVCGILVLSVALTWLCATEFDEEFDEDDE